MVMNKAILLVPILIALSVGGAAQTPQTNASQQSTIPTTTGKLAGSAFLITKSGDLKPARLASIRLLYFEGGQTSTTPGVVYKGNEEVVTKMWLKKLTVDKLTGEDLCQWELEAHRAALESAVKSAAEQGKTGQVRTADADEEGRFKVNGIPAGHYTLIVWGQAGMNTAFWRENIVVVAGKITSIKLSKPRTACLQL
jgi:hypothetical protein